MRVDVAAAEEHRRAVQRSAIVAREARRANETGAQAGNAGVAFCIARREFEGEAAALGEADQCDAIGGDAAAGKVVDDRRNGGERPRQMRLVLLQRREKRARIPGAARRARSDVGKIGLPQRAGQAQDVVGAATAAVQQHDGGAGVLERRAGGGDGHGGGRHG